MIIRHLYLEPDESMHSDLVKGIAGALDEFMAFHHCQDILIEHSEPAGLKAAIMKKINHS